MPIQYGGVWMPASGSLAGQGQAEFMQLLSVWLVVSVEPVLEEMLFGCPHEPRLHEIKIVK